MKGLIGSLALAVLFSSFGLAADEKQETLDTKCNYILAEGDKFLQRVPLCEESAQKHASIAMAYYKRYELCKEQKDSEMFIVNRLAEEKPFRCENHKKGKQ